jgi:hypothetical protein
VGTSLYETGRPDTGLSLLGLVLSPSTPTLIGICCTHILNTRFLCGAASAKPETVRGFFSTTYPTPHRLSAGGFALSNGIGTESSCTTVFWCPSMLGSIRKQKRCWWLVARTLSRSTARLSTKSGLTYPGLTTLPYGDTSPGRIAQVLRIPEISARHYLTGLGQPRLTSCSRLEMEPSCLIQLPGENVPDPISNDIHPTQSRLTRSWPQ